MDVGARRDVPERQKVTQLRLATSGGPLEGRKAVCDGHDGCERVADDVPIRFTTEPALSTLPCKYASLAGQHSCCTKPSNIITVYL